MTAVVGKPALSTASTVSN